jgi:hypothetical protein
MEIWDKDGKYKVYSIDQTKWIEIQFEQNEMLERAHIKTNAVLTLEEETLDERHDRVV